MINLFERNFDIERDRAHRPDDAISAEAADELREKLDAARQEGFDAGRKIGQQDAEAAQATAEAEMVATARKEIRDQLMALTKKDDEQRIQMERDIVELFSGIAERLVPELLENYGIDLAIGRIRKSLARTRTDPVLSIRACPDVVGVLKCDAPEWLQPGTPDTQIDLKADASMNPGAVQVEWQGGRLEYDLHAACLEMLQALAEAAAEYETTSEKAG